MSEDKLKDWIREERDQFESESPREGIWEEIESQVHGSSAPPKRSWIKWSIAAAVAALVCMTLFYQLSTPDSGLADQESSQNGVQEQEFFPLLSPEMQEAQSFYASQVNERMTRLSKYPIDADLKEEMDLLTEEFEMLQAEMGQGLDDSKVVEAMIDNYRLRLDLLEDLLKALDRKPEDIGKTINDGHEI